MNRTYFPISLLLALTAISCSIISGFGSSPVVKTAASPTDIEGIAGIKLGAAANTLTLTGYQPLLNSTSNQLYEKTEELRVRGLRVKKVTRIGVKSGFVAVCEVSLYTRSLRDFHKLAPEVEQGLRGEYDPGMFPQSLSPLMGPQVGEVNLEDAQGDKLGFAAANGEVLLRLTR